MKKRKTTIKDIAKEVGVSHPVVSVILGKNKNSSVGFREETRQKVLEAAKRLNYQPNILAQSFRRSESLLIGVLGLSVNSTFFAEILRGMQEVMFKKDYVPMLLSHSNSKEESANLKRAMHRQIDALIVNTSVEPGNKRVLNKYAELINKGFPLVELLGVSIDKAPYVISDNVMIGYNSVKHLAKLGHKKIALFTHDKYNIGLANPGECWDALELYNGYMKGIEEAGLEPFIFTHPLKKYPNLSPQDWLEYSKEACPQILNDPSITGVICYMDYHASSLIQTAHERGIKVPDQLSVMSYLNLGCCELSSPKITSWEFDAKEIGKNAAELVLKLLDGKKADSVLLPCSLIERESTAAAFKAN